MMTDREKKVREEFRNPVFRKMLQKELPCKCQYCGSSKELEYHHLVPIGLGGDNRLSNIIPLCHAHHMAITHGGTMENYRDNTNRGGRPTTVPFTEAEEYIDMYVRGEIGTKCLRSKLKMGESSKLKDNALYKRYVARYGIVSLKNHIDLLTSCRAGGIKKRSVLVTIDYANGCHLTIRKSGIEFVQGA